MPGVLATRLRAVSQPSVRLKWLHQWIASCEPAEVASVIEELLHETECFEPEAVPALVSVVAWSAGALEPRLLRRIAEVAEVQAMYRLSRLLAYSHDCPDLLDGPQLEAPVPNYVRARPLRLGERKNLARRASRKIIEMLVRDPHPAVIEQLLFNPRLTEDDLLRLVTFRPPHVRSLCLVVRDARWVTSARIRSGLLHNADVPKWLTVPLLSLCTRPELLKVVRARGLPGELRAIAAAHLERHPPLAQRQRHSTVH